MQTFNVQAKYQGGYTQKRTATRYLVVHHAAAHYKQQTGLEDVEAVRWWHMEGGNGWPGIAYHICLAEETNGGAIARYNTSAHETLRYHIASRNHECLGVSCLTDFGNTIPLDKWIDALADVLRELAAKYPGAQIVGHKEITVPGYGTRCPGDRWLEWKPELLRRVSTPPEPNYLALWGTAAPYNHLFGIPTRWRAALTVRPWGRALSIEYPTHEGSVQFFERMAATWNRTTGKIEEYWKA